MSPHPDRNRKLPRLKYFDYTSDGAYFVTICVHNREQIFGEIRDGKMILNEFGKITEKCWRDLPSHYSNCMLDEFVVMPNHFHGIVMIDNLGFVGNGFKPFPTTSTSTDARSTKQHGLSEIIRGFKTFSSRRINELIGGTITFRWQKSFFDRIIRDEDELNRIRDYIWQNPENWEKDEENLKC
ncbi:MAG: transposase [Patescibacteria group bacterium]